MAYTRTTWVKNQTPLSAENFNNIEDAVTKLDKLIYLDSSGVCQVGDSKGVEVASLNSLGDVTTSAGASLNQLNSNLFSEKTISTRVVFGSNNSNGNYVTHMIPLLNADKLTISDLSLKSLDGASNIRQVGITEANPLGFCLYSSGVSGGNAYRLTFTVK